MLIDFKAVDGTKTKVLDELRLTLTLFSIPLLSTTAGLMEGLPAIRGLLSAFSLGYSPHVAECSQLSISYLIPFSNYSH